jgi:hypothetical protein
MSLSSAQVALLILARVHVEVVLLAAIATTKITSATTTTIAPVATKIATATFDSSVGDVVLARLSKFPALLMG